jgi:hypothetical protein
MYHFHRSFHGSVTGILYLPDFLYLSFALPGADLLEGALDSLD